MKIIVNPDIWTTEQPSRWPEAPKDISVTALTEIEACPRRWSLRHADYPKLWGGHGYPPRVHMGALLGSVAHLALETIIREFIRNNCPSVKHATAVSVMRSLGGYRHILDNCINRVIDRLRANPRAQHRLESLTQFLRARIPHLRTQVQSILSRTHLDESGSSEYGRSSGFRRPLAAGTYSELEVRARRIGWKGKVDLLRISPEACEITDFKTGAPTEAHRFQIEVYALLWTLDEERNPQGRSPDRLILAYDNGEVEVPVPSLGRRKALEQDLSERGAAVRTSVSQSPPEAKPDLAHCGSCQVRQLCEEYWTSGVRKRRHDEDRGKNFGDFEVTIMARHGPSSWDARFELPGDRRQVVVRTTAGEKLKIGDRLRFLDGAIFMDEENPEQPAIVTLGATSEKFTVLL